MGIFEKYKDVNVFIDEELMILRWNVIFCGKFFFMVKSVKCCFWF